ncbi:hypothetical protein B296_00046548, partial [Ensete ventricosum]
MISVVKLYVVIEESVLIGSVHVHKLVCVSRKETRKLKRGLLGLECASRDALIRWLSWNPIRSAHTADLTQVRSAPPTCKCTPHCKDSKHGGRVRQY